MEEVHDTHHLLIPIGLFLDENRVRCENPWSGVEMVSHGDVDTVHVLRWDPIYIPFANEVTTFFIQETHRQIPYTDINT